MSKIDAKQVDKTGWNDHKKVDLKAPPDFNIFNPLNETTYLKIIDNKEFLERNFIFDSKTEDGGGARICDGRPHKICVINTLSYESIEINVGLSADEWNDGSIIRETKGTTLLLPQRAMTISFYWVEFEDRRYCIVHHVIT